jgi:hypothetical protein
LESGNDNSCKTLGDMRTHAHSVRVRPDARFARAHEPGAHAHGVAELRIVVDGPQLEVELETPLDNVLGFEHAPRTDKQRAAVRAMAMKLRQPQMFRPTPAARCQSASTKIESAVLPPALLGESTSMPPADAATKPAAGQEDAHADLDASFTWRCAVPADLKGLEIGLLQGFPRMQQVNVQIVGPKGQSAKRLTAGQRSVSW